MISIIVPIYKVEKFLPKCIESILNQTYLDFELILVDDGSPDKCPEICDEYAAKDQRIIVIHQKNSGVSAARNAGLKRAQGQYIGFVDPDDFIASDMYEKMVQAMETSDVQLVICGYDYVDEDGKVIQTYSERKDEVITQKEVLKCYFDMPPSIRLGVWNKLFINSLLHGIEFTEGIKGAEDAEVLGKYLQMVNQTFFVHKPLYKNCERQGSATRGGLKGDSVTPALDIYLKTREYIRQNYPELECHAQKYYMDACLLNYGIHCKGNMSKQNILVANLRKRIRNEFPSAFFNREIFWKTRVYYILFALGMKG